MGKELSIRLLRSLSERNLNSICFDFNKSNNDKIDVYLRGGTSGFFKLCTLTLHEYVSFVRWNLNEGAGQEWLNQNLLFDSSNKIVGLKLDHELAKHLFDAQISFTHFPSKQGFQAAITRLASDKEKDNFAKQTRAFSSQDHDSVNPEEYVDVGLANDSFNDEKIETEEACLAHKNYLEYTGALSLPLSITGTFTEFEIRIEPLSNLFNFQPFRPDKYPDTIALNKLDDKSWKITS
ncbi:hypothetical protein TUMSATVNIG1_60640 (plasmid) [Vibrio nigripulchritudo]|uniref:hypothetical protein n=1 Tax=Vibrio nigripulchritudo TaxID=28173 RepID=UPI00190A95FB|nr:hypothetical protein [Vibrio nigripulchritudo]BCL74080.1 hypothetical protein VNTUMSATTG_60170 [Vibrio nigripulchritudo]BDU35455.1 hypothetical protein TUMSATVNIG1_60640 [Vibrio nigripulchritudo]